MRIITNIIEANDLLKSYKDAMIHVAFYTESLKRMAIRISLPTQDEIVYLTAIACESMKGYFVNFDSNLSITTKIDDKTKEIITEISDIKSGFEICTSGGFSIAKGLPFEFGNSFDNFIKEKN